MTWKRTLLPALIGILLLALLIPELRREKPPVGPGSRAGGDPEMRGIPRTPPEASEECAILVRDREGRPCRATVFATGLGGRPPERADVIGRTDADGRLARSDFSLEPRGSVFAVAPGRTAPPVPMTPRGAELTLGDGVVVTGTVRDKEGDLLSGVLVTVGRPYHNHSVTTTDRAGRFRLTGLLPGAWNVEGRVERGLRSCVVVEATTWNESCAVELSGFPAAGTSVIVDVRYSSPPGADPQLVLRDGGKRGKTLWLPRADALVRIEAKEKREIEVVCPGFRSAKARLLSDPVAAETTVRLDLQAGPGMPRSILVVDPAGRPVPGALVLLARNDDDHYPKAPHTGPDGRLALGAHHRGQFAVASADAGASGRTRIVEGTEEIVLRLLPGAVLTGRVVDRDTGEPVAGTGVRLQGGDCGCCSPWETKTDESGEYRFAGIPAGLFVQPFATGGDGVRGTRADMPRSHAEALERRLGHLVEGAETARFADLRVARHPVVTHRFRLDPGAPGEPVRIEGLLEGGSFYPRLDDDGIASVVVRPGRRLFRIHSGDRVGLVEVAEGAGAEVSPVRLSAPARVTAVLTGPDGRPAVGPSLRVKVEVYLRETGEEVRVGWGGGNTNRLGRADLTGDLIADGPPGIENVLTLERGSYRIPGGTFRITAADLAARPRESGGEVVLQIPVAEVGRNAPIPVLVVDRDGRPVPGVRIGDPDEPGEAVLTDSSGRAVIRRGWEPLLPFVGDWSLPVFTRDEPIRLEVERGRRVRLRIVDARGKPVAGEWLEDVDETFFDETGADGRLDLVLPLRIDPLVLRGEDWWLGAVDLAASDGEIDILALPRRHLDVTVRGPKELVVERRVLVSWQVDAPPGTEAAGSGKIDQEKDTWCGRLALPPFSGKLRALTTNLRYEARGTAPVTGSKVELRLARLPDHEVILVLLDPEGRPLAGREVECDHASFTTGALVPRRVRTDEAGRLCLKLPEGDHRLTAVEVGDLGIDEVRFSSPAPGNVEVRLREW